MWLEGPWVVSGFHRGRVVLYEPHGFVCSCFQNRHKSTFLVKRMMARLDSCLVKHFIMSTFFQYLSPVFLARVDTMWLFKRRFRRGSLSNVKKKMAPLRRLL